MRDHDALLAFVAGRRSTPFEWGRSQNDCVSFCLGAIAAQNGRKIAPRVSWSSRIGALRVANRAGGLADIVTAHLTEIAPAQAHRGDVAGVTCGEFPGGVRLMIVEGATLVGPGEFGTERQQRSDMIRAWSIDA